MFFNFPKEIRKFPGIFSLGALFLVLLGTFGPGSLKMKKDEIQVAGRIYVMGNEPFTQVGIQLDNGKVYALTGGYDKELRSLRGKLLTVKGKLSGKTPRRPEAIEVKSFQLSEKK
jgi:hypothetical protein